MTRNIKDKLDYPIKLGNDKIVTTLSLSGIDPTIHVNKIYSPIRLDNDKEKETVLPQVGLKIPRSG